MQSTAAVLSDRVAARCPLRIASLACRSDGAVLGRQRFMLQRSNRNIGESQGLVKRVSLRCAILNDVHVVALIINTLKCLRSLLINVVPLFPTGLSWWRYFVRPTYTEDLMQGRLYQGAFGSANGGNLIGQGSFRRQVLMLRLSLGQSARRRARVLVDVAWRAALPERWADTTLPDQRHRVRHEGRASSAQTTAKGGSGGHLRLPITRPAPSAPAALNGPKPMRSKGCQGVLHSARGHIV